MASLTLYEHIDFTGKTRIVSSSQSTLGDFNRLTSSIVITQGHWQFFTEPGYKGIAGLQPSYSLGPGSYRWVVDKGIPNDSIQSVKLISG